MREKTRKGIVKFINTNYKKIIIPKDMFERVFYIRYFVESIHDRFGNSQEINKLIHETIKLINKKTL